MKIFKKTRDKIFRLKFFSKRSRKECLVENNLKLELNTKALSIISPSLHISVVKINSPICMENSASPDFLGLLLVTRPTLTGLLEVRCFGSNSSSSEAMSSQAISTSSLLDLLDEPRRSSQSMVSETMFISSCSHSSPHILPIVLYNCSVSLYLRLRPSK